MPPNMKQTMTCLMRRVDTALAASAGLLNYRGIDGFSPTFQIRIHIDGTPTNIKIVFGSQDACIILVNGSKFQCSDFSRSEKQPFSDRYDAYRSGEPTETDELSLGEFDFIMSSHDNGFALFRPPSKMYSQFTPISPGWLVDLIQGWQNDINSGKYRQGVVVGNLTNLRVTAIQDSSSFRDSMTTVYRKQIVYSKRGVLNYTLDVAEFYRNPRFSNNKTVVRYMNPHKNTIEHDIERHNLYDIMQSNQQMIAPATLKAAKPDNDV